MPPNGTGAPVNLTPFTDTIAKSSLLTSWKII